MPPTLDLPRSFSSAASVWTPHLVVNRGFASSAATKLEPQAAPASASPQPRAPRSPRPQQPYLLETGQLYDATVTNVKPKLAEVDVKVPSTSGGTPSIVKACLPVASLTYSKDRIEDLSTVLKAGEQLKVLSMGKSISGDYGAHVATKFLEAVPGAMLTDRQGVFAGAEKKAAVYQAEGVVKRAKRKAFEASLQVGDVLQAEFVATNGTSDTVTIDGNLYRLLRRALRSLGSLKARQIIQLQVTEKPAEGGLRFQAVGASSS